LKLGDEDTDAESEKALEEKFLPLLDWMQATLLNDIEKVRVSKRLTTSPAALVASDFGWTANMERLMEGQAKQNKDAAMHQFMKSQKKILEINPGHPLIVGMLARASKDPKGYENDKHFQEMAKVLYDITLVRSGYSLKGGVKAFAGRVENMLRVNLGVDEAAEAVFEAPQAEDRDQEEIDAEIEKRGDILKADDVEPGSMTPEELNRMMKEFTESTNPPLAGPGGKKVEVNVDDIVAEAEQELDSDEPKETIHDEL
jgi:heat shock protein beta